MRTLRASFSILLLGLAVIVSGCGTIINGSSQQVSIASTPSGADVIIDGADVGETPITQKLSRKDQHTIELRLDGYESESIIVNRGVSGWVVGNIVLGGLIGLGVDAITGGMYKLDPTDIQRTLDESGSASLGEGGDIVHIAVVMEPRPGWEKIGQLTPTTE
jgi:hypothetical protein